MGWLRPEPQLIQAPNWVEDGAAHAAPDEPLPELPVTALGQTVTCARLCGTTTTTTTAVLDRGFEFCPALSRHGFPLMLKRELQDHTDRVDTGRLTDEELAAKRFVYRLMTTPGEGLATLFAMGGDSTRLPPVLAARGDGVDFGASEWRQLRAYFEEYAPLDPQLAVRARQQQPQRHATTSREPRALFLGATLREQRVRAPARRRSARRRTRTHAKRRPIST